MATVVQNDQKDYDIYVAIVFEKSNLGNLGPQAARNMVANALKKKTKQFNTEPEVKTSCVSFCIPIITEHMRIKMAF